MELGLFSQAAYYFAAAHRALVAVYSQTDFTRAGSALDPQVVAASIASIEAHQAAVLSRTGHQDAANELFDSADEKMEHCVHKLGQVQENSLLVVQVMRARVLRLHAKHQETAGNARGAAGLRERATRLETTHGFASS